MGYMENIWGLDLRGISQWISSSFVAKSKLKDTSTDRPWPRSNIMGALGWIFLLPTLVRADLGAEGS